MLNGNFIYLALFLSALGGAGYMRDTLRGVTSPNRVTWGLWAVEGILAFIVEKQDHVGSASLMTLMLGLVPCFVFLASFRHKHGVWQLGPFDIVCGVISLAGLLFWLVIGQATVALVSFVAADQMAALPTLRKSFLAPHTETAWSFFMGTLNCTITVLTLKHFTTAGFLFPGAIAVADLLIVLTIVTKIGPRLRGEALHPAA